MGKERNMDTMPSQAEHPKAPSHSIFVFSVEPGKRGAVVKVFIAGVLALLMFSVVINSYVQLNEVYSEISDANSELSDLRSENVRMQTELEGKASISNIKEYAEDHLGLQKLDKSQIQYVEIQTEDDVTIEEGEQNIFVQIKHKFEDFVAYLRG